MQEIFEHNRFVQFAEDAFLLVKIWIVSIIFSLTFFKEPLAHFVIADEVVFETNRAEINFIKLVNYFSE